MRAVRCLSLNTGICTDFRDIHDFRLIRINDQPKTVRITELFIIKGSVTANLVLETFAAHAIVESLYYKLYIS